MRMMCRHSLAIRGVIVSFAIAGMTFNPEFASAKAPLIASPKARAAKPAPVRPSGIPTDAELRSQGARIGEIRINSRPIFDSAAGDEDTRFGRLANRLHVQTRDTTLANQLLFRSGDVYDPRLIEESARLLRAAGYLHDAWITPVAYHDNVVDLEVRAQDVWTLNPGLAFSRQGGENSFGFKIEEMNLLGTGSELDIGYTSDVDRDSTAIAFKDENLGASWWSLSTTYSDNSDGHLAALALDHPFYALDVRRAGGFGIFDNLRTDSRYDLGEVIDRYQIRQKFATIYLGTSAGLRGRWVQRWSAGFTYDDHQFDAAPEEAAPQLLPADRRLSYPWIAAEWVEDDFRTARNRDQIEKTEDYALGWRAILRLGYATESFGADRDAFTFSGYATKGLQLSGLNTLHFDATVRGRVEHGAVAGGIAQTGARLYVRQTSRRLFFMGLSAVSGENLDDDQQILLGGDSGLRGYPLRYQSGTGRWLFTVEQRWFSNWYPFQLFNVGGAVFYDMGATWGRDPLGSPSQGLLRDIGFGLRLGNGRSALGNVIHVDLAFPLDGDPTIDEVQLVVQTRQTF
jgi:outer membrane protein assembly factor BamA